LEVAPLVDLTADDFRLAVDPLAEHRGTATADEIKEQYDTVVGRWREHYTKIAGVTRPDYGSQLWEQQEYLSLYMLGAAKATALGRRVAPGVVHIDGTTRPQVLHGDEAPAVGAALDALQRHGAPPVLLNTSFNDKGEPVVNTADDALAAFRAMDLDFLVLGDALYRKPNRAGGAR
ncbi:carbamoyltransferase C-terminal domain-containing protein, partial [Streptomyces lydicus]